MMLLRHGAFARKGRQERRRNFAIASVAALLLIITATIIGMVKAAGSSRLDGSDGLTSGNITATVTASDSSVPTDLARDSKLILNLTFNIDPNKEDVALDGSAWTYDLSDLIGGSGAIIESVSDVQGGTIYFGSINAGTFSVSNNIITMNVDGDAFPESSRITAGISVELNVDPKKVGTDLSDNITIPGSTVQSPIPVTFETPTVEVNEFVFDDQNDSWRSDNVGNVAIEKDAQDRYIATYNADFKTNSYIDDLTVTIDLSNNQSFTGDIEIARCAYTNCADNVNVPKTTIPSSFITYVDDDSDGSPDKAVIDMVGFLDSCEAANACLDGNSNKVLNGYEINPSDGSVNDKYQLIYHGVIEGAMVDTYRSDIAISGTDSSQNTLQDTDFVQYTSVSDPIDGSKTGAIRTQGDTTFIDYEIVIGDTNADLSSKTIEDFISDNQVLTSDGITITSNSGSTVTIPKNDSSINSAAIDNNYSTSRVKLFDYTFPANSNDGPYTITYTVELPITALGKDIDVTNNVNLVVGGYTYSDIAKTVNKHDFKIPQTYVTKEVVSVDRGNGIIEWLVKIYGPEDPDEAAFTDIYVNDYTWNTGSIPTTFNSATVTTNGVTTAPENANPPVAISCVIHDGQNPDQAIACDQNVYNERVKIDQLSHGQVANLTYYTRASQEYINQYAGQSIKITNFASVDIDGRTVEDNAEATILQPSPDDVQKTVKKDGSVAYFYENDNGGNPNYQASNRDGFIWTVMINDQGKGATTPDYEPYFTDTIPSGLYLAYGANYDNYPTYNTGIDDDVTQANFVTKIEVERIVNGNWTQDAQKTVDVTLTINPDGSATINPINLAALYNRTDGTCDVATQIVPTSDCAGINNASYKITYKTSIKDSIFRDFAHDHDFVNFAKLQEEIEPGVFSTRAYDNETAHYVTDTAIKKHDVSPATLDSDNLIEYNIHVNTQSASLNSGDDLTFTDTIAANMSFYPQDFYTTGSEANDANNSPIVCVNGTTGALISGCSFTFDSLTSTITGTVPDEEYIIVKYRTRVNDPIPSSVQTFANTASLTNQYNTNFESTVSTQHTINASQAWVDAHGIVQLLKVDSDDTSTTISGVTFHVEEQTYDSTTGTISTTAAVDDFTTGSNGIATVDSLDETSVTNGTPTYGGLYYWEETAAPSPYVPVDTTRKHYFMVYEISHIATEMQDNRDAALAMAQLIINNSDISEIAVVPSGYQWIVTNIAQNTAPLNVEKTVSGNLADPTKDFTVTITATDSRQVAINGSVEAYSYNLDDPTTMTAIAGGVIFTNGEAQIMLKHGQGIKLNGLFVGGSYEVEEDDYSSALEGMYETSYICADGQDGNGSCSGTVAAAGQTVAIKNTSEDTLAGISTKKSSNVVIFTIAGSLVATFGVIFVTRLRRQA